MRKQRGDTAFLLSWLAVAIVSAFVLAYAYAGVMTAGGQ